MVYMTINADDYGYNPNSTRAIRECLLKGWITNTTLMVNMASTAEAVAMAKKDNLTERIGLHLNLTWKTPLTEEIRGCGTFCDANGEFNRAFRKGLRRSWTPLTVGEKKVLREEVAAQFQKYLDLGMSVRHYDSHHHSHLIPNVVATICEVAHDFGFRSVRRPINLAVRSHIRSKVFYALQNAYLDSRLKRHCFFRTDFFGAFEDVKSSIPMGLTKELATVEMMVHPMYIKDGNVDESGELNDSGLRPFSEVSEFLKIHQGELSLKSFKDLYEGC